MKSIYKIFLLALGVYTSAFSQITEISKLPVQDFSQSIEESTFFLLLKLESTLNSSSLESGVYIYQLRVNDFITSKKMVILR